MWEIFSLGRHISPSTRPSQSAKIAQLVVKALLRTIVVPSGPFQSVPFITYGQLSFHREPREFVYFHANFIHGVVVSCYFLSPVQYPSVLPLPFVFLRIFRNW